MTKMYIAIKSSLPTGMAMNTASHAGLIGWLSFKHLPDTETWLADSFKKVTLKVSDVEFEALKLIQNHKVITESALMGAEVGIVLAPRPADEWPEFVRKLQLWR